MKKLAIAVVLASVPAFGWERVCAFTFDKKYDGVTIGSAQVYRQREANRWSYAVGLSGVSVAGHKCGKGEILTGYVGAKVRSSSVGYLDTGDVKVRGKKPQTYWKFFDQVYLKNCHEGARIWASWVCEKSK